MKSLIKSVTNGKSVLILGYGREGQSTLRLLDQCCPQLPLTVADADPLIVHKHPELNHEKLTVITGPAYLDKLNHFDLVIKSPGISLFNSGASFVPERISSQTDLFLRAYAPQVAGITGTKGKSTTSSLLHHIIRTYTSDTLLAGNIGIPLFDLVDKITPATRIICELSSHQLEFITRAPSISILLNLFQEHLDHYASFRHYQLAKFQIALKQQFNDAFLYDGSDVNILKLMEELRLPGRKFPVYTGEFPGNGAGISGKNIVLRSSGTERILLSADHKGKLAGTHNLRNIISAASAAGMMNIPAAAIAEGVATFTPLEHRIEFAGNFSGKDFYNDSISTIPEATMAAVATLKKVDTLILGGYDRGIEYNGLADFICRSGIKNVILTGPAGERILGLLKQFKKCNPAIFFIREFEPAIEKAASVTPAGGACLLSPAASSYDRFKNFEERGRLFKELVSRN
ncbi:UDP-N-acetylmuramoyl-L-alanine--D-glutamate ligase [Lentimicrobium sp.]|jgi:UDP-N-acetylmuramoylalanine--D-glutamate ligase|uniref:UDP-N-acetylmuramoyl-L-alanine--D-glutamate ligase n=1 Tax=Lentimicrobium sp. TaxID=2034841 RepID=UPI002CD11F67|nr:UDP-N-acetylmuramoyl-L-alanine--D-glutamate ligase [Lentimicrobium sp.]HPF65394.1 UDP-N-acetylmuramoyl-L-alanine--D-glutamate ligase [Lentimicrobium sp.]HPJ62961.1 UDP-N-acetylmuramoyl-L-alanine--D-glutamate ligase [Lentimicrobium sp.]HPR26713.1 UDP-N-acetylmuramoyl-L-alanine--D-glutamate ligase [Lentimicrobium sp.]HRW69908.1 UDP-N-acetylmuramoyl-L-alanine--D-glutamate ligase [Lentimicrobium sp.]